MRKTAYMVRPEKDTVVLTIGNADITMDYETALKLSQQFRVAGKQAKLFAGDLSNHWSIIANLRDAKDNFVNLIKPNLLQARESDIAHITKGKGG